MKCQINNNWNCMFILVKILSNLLNLIPIWYIAIQNTCDVSHFWHMICNIIWKVCRTSNITVNLFWPKYQLIYIIWIRFEIRHSSTKFSWDKATHLLLFIIVKLNLLNCTGPQLDFYWINISVFYRRPFDASFSICWYGFRFSFTRNL